MDIEDVYLAIESIMCSFLFDAIAPCEAELYKTYLYIDELEKRVYADTSYGEYLKRRCAEHGIYKKEATHAIRKGYSHQANGVGYKLK